MIKCTVILDSCYSIDIPMRYTVNSPSSTYQQIESGGCSLVSTGRINGVFAIICNNPSSSVLFDGVIPSYHIWYGKY